MENNSDLKKRFKSVVTELHKSVECPVCLETVKIPFKACLRGHGVCLECTEKLEKCPLCQELFTLENLICLKSMLEALPQFCRYSDAGCEEIVEPGNDHEMFCGYRPILCPLFACSTRMPLTEFLDHHKTHHREWFMCTKLCGTGISWMAGYCQSFSCTPVFIFKNLFWICYMLDEAEKQLKFFFRATPIGKLEHDYYVRVKLKKDELVYTYSLKAAQASEKEYHDIRNVSEVLVKEYCMRIPEAELSNFKNEKGKIEFSLNFFRR